MVYSGFLTLTHSHLYHFRHFPTMVGFCHGGNMLGNHHHRHPQQHHCHSSSGTSTIEIIEAVAGLLATSVIGILSIDCYQHQLSCLAWVTRETKRQRRRRRRGGWRSASWDIWSPTQMVNPDLVYVWQWWLIMVINDVVKKKENLWAPSAKAKPPPSRRMTPQASRPWNNDDADNED